MSDKTTRILDCVQDDIAGQRVRLERLSVFLANESDFFDSIGERLLQITAGSRSDHHGAVSGELTFFLKEEADNITAMSICRHFGGEWRRIPCDGYYSYEGNPGGVRLKIWEAEHIMPAELDAVVFTADPRRATSPAIAT